MQCHSTHTCCMFLQSAWTIPGTARFQGHVSVVCMDSFQGKMEPGNTSCCCNNTDKGSTWLSGYGDGFDFHHRLCVVPNIPC